MAGAASASIVLGILGFLAAEAWPALRDVGLLRLLTDDAWYPSEAQFGQAPMLLGSLLVMLGAVLLAAPIGTLVALHCHFVAPPRLAAVQRRIVEVLGGIPSVVYGLWGLVVLVPWLAPLAPPGTSLFAGIVVLAVMVLPTMAITADAAFAAVAPELLASAAALGLTRWGTLRAAVLPAARSALLSGLILQSGRALGETMAVLMVCGNIVQVPSSLLEPVRTLTANIALEMAYASGTHRAALFASGLLLAVVVALLVAAAAALSRSHARRTP
jgi:phosphate transport system permease protein